MTLIRMSDAVTHVAAVCRGTVGASPRTHDDAAAATDRRPPVPALHGLPAQRAPAHVFTPAGVGDGQLRTLLERAWRIHRAGLPPGGTGADALAVVGHRPSAAGRGGDLYSVGTVGTPVREIPRLPPLCGFYMEAPLLLLVCGDLRRVSDPPTGSGYPALLSAAGALGHALWLTALSAGLGGRVYTSGCRPATTAVRRHRPGMRHLLTVAVGHIDGRYT
ncbi:hypothetical protein GCM10011583_14810 [Streptomyces camponoticapitis]|uniref:Nitroreductase domain-containing protein n=1 Tax=Streptomyces camponoticapitis TaxID=1616125 RepID=A0ABQ2E0G8_9ACTN|nr:hypothetical protein [Streptomyces camponoticapitis]GGJ84208.1 hypothetical protein GCM10011583_14810 [Streptomyces camponoticapitis]